MEQKHAHRYCRALEGSAIWHFLSHSGLAQHAETEVTRNKLNLIAHLVGCQGNCHLTALDLPQQVDRYKDRFGVYPESVHADQIYRTRANRQWCKARGIRLSGPPLGRPAATAKSDLARQAQQDARIRNAIEGKFGQGKRRFSLNRVMAKLPHTAATTMAITVLVMNLERRLRPLVLFFARLTYRYLAEEIGRLRALSGFHWLVEMGNCALI